MENASKALIIAGAILISILLISVGIMVMNSTDEVTGGMQQQMDSTAIQTFNSQFSNYIGTQSASVARSLCSTVIANNATSSHQVTVNGKATSAEISAESAALDTKNNYLIHTDAIKNYILPDNNYYKNKEWLKYAEEADILNVVLLILPLKNGENSILS